MNDELDIPEFLRRPKPTPEEKKKLARKRAREAQPLAVLPPAARVKINRDKDGRPLPRGMDAGSWALLAKIEAAAVVKGKEDEAAKKERFHILGAERAAQAAIKRAAKAAHTKG